MRNARKLTDKMRRGEVCLGASITFTDPTVSEALAGLHDFVWIDMEHNALALETVQGHIMATRASDAAALVRVPGNDHDLVKPILDMGADGVVVPQVQSAAEARRAVAACRYPPQGTRGVGPRRANDYGRAGGPEYFERANAEVIAMVQIEHAAAVANLDDILATPGLTGIVIGPADLAASLGLLGRPQHPQVLSAIDAIARKAREAGVFAGIGGVPDADLQNAWIENGIRFLLLGADYTLLLQGAAQAAGQVRAPAARPGAKTL